jgi:hypothetical protein
VTRYFARQLLNKHAKNYQNAEKITKFLLSTKVVWKSIKHLSKTKSVKRFPSLKLCFFSSFSFSLVQLIEFVMQIWRRDDWPRVPSTQSAQGEWWSAGFRRFSWAAWASSLQFGCTVQLCRHGPVTVLNEFLNNRLCYYGVFGWISCDNQNITNFKEKLLKKLPKIFNYQKSQKNRKILPKVIKITKSGHTEFTFNHLCFGSAVMNIW